MATIDELAFMNHRDRFFDNDGEHCLQCGKELPETENQGLVIDEDGRCFCCEKCCDNYDVGTEEDLDEEPDLDDSFPMSLEYDDDDYFDY